MKPKFAIVSDGSCDLPAEEAARHDIEVVHFLVSFDGERYVREGADISLSEFYQQMHDHPGSIRRPPPLPRKIFCAPLKVPPEKALSSCASAFPQAQFFHAVGSDCPGYDGRVPSRSYNRGRRFPLRHPDAERLCSGGLPFKRRRLLSGRSHRRNGKLRKTARILFTVGDLDYIGMEDGSER